MARIDTAKLRAQVGNVAVRTDRVRRDPAVTKAAQEAGGDCAQAYRSVSALAREVGAAWRRSASAA
jgi:hypothetical protein